MTRQRALIAVVIAAAAALLGSACVASSSTTCNGLVCPEGTTCAPSGERCVDVDLVAACRTGDTGETCSVPGLPPGTCLAGVCQASRCGDGRVTGAEECDASDFDGRTCQTLGFYSKQGLACTADCKYDTSQCVGRCGDSIKNGPEQCDGADLKGATCFTAGFYAAPGLACKQDCTFDTTRCGGGRCGDSIINGLEQCDGRTFATTCGQLGFRNPLSGMICSPACTHSARSCLCSGGHRCAAWTQRCECSKFGCGCAAAQ